MDEQIILREVSRNLGDHRQAKRLFHGRGHTFPGLEHLVIDLFFPVVILQIFKDEPQISRLPALLENLFPQADRLCWLLQERHLPKAPWTLLQGQLPARPLAREAKLNYELQLMRNQNSGFFLDMKLGRQLVARLAPGARVLNLFAYSCSFSVVAMAHGARSVCNMDISKSALRLGKTNHVLNGLDSPEVQYLPHDVLKSFGRMNRLGPFSLVVIDPPTLQRGAFDAEKDYRRIVRRLPEFLAANAQVVACLNSPMKSWSFLEELFGDPVWVQQGRYQRPDEFPELEAEQSLKILHLTYRPQP